MSAIFNNSADDDNKIPKLLVKPRNKSNDTIDNNMSSINMNVLGKSL